MFSKSIPLVTLWCNGHHARPIRRRPRVRIRAESTFLRQINGVISLRCFKWWPGPRNNITNRIATSLFSAKVEGRLSQHGGVTHRSMSMVWHCIDIPRTRSQLMHEISQIRIEICTTQPGIQPGTSPGAFCPLQQYVFKR